MPLALFLKLARTAKEHLMIAHRPYAPKKKPFWRFLKPQTHVSTIFVLATSQRNMLINRLGVAWQKVVRIPYWVDEQFWKPLPDVPEKHQIASAGLEWRDYPTL